MKITMSKLRSVATSIWSDPFIEDCSVSEKLLFIYLLTNEKTNMLGIYEASIKKIAFETGINKADVEKALKRFESLGKVKHSGNYVVLVNFLKHQSFNPNMKKSAIDVYLSLPEHLKIQGFDPDRENHLEAFESLSKHLGMLPKIEVEEEGEGEGEDEKENIEIFLPFETDTFKAQWQLWKQYRKQQHRFTYKSPASEQAALTELGKMSGSQEKKAIAILHHTMAHGWRGFVEPKPEESSSNMINVADI